MAKSAPLNRTEARKPLVNSSSQPEIPATAPIPPAAPMPFASSQERPLLTLAIDVGGSGLKAAVLDPGGDIITGAERVHTPNPSNPLAVVTELVGLAAKLGDFDRISVGFPGVVRHGHVLTAPNLGTDVWHRFPLADELSRLLGRPTRILNDATVQGLGVINEVGIECVITLGTGFGFALFEEGLLGAHLELGQHPITKGKTYDLYLGNAALRKVGRAKWNKRLKKALGYIDTLVTFDTLLIGGGNARLIDFTLPANARIVPNAAGITGGVKLWAPKLAIAFREQPPRLRHPPQVTPAPLAP